MVETETGKQKVDKVRTSKASPRAAPRRAARPGGARARSRRAAGLPCSHTAPAPVCCPPGLAAQGMFLRRGHDPVISDIEARIAKWTLMPVRVHRWWGARACLWSGRRAPRAGGRHELGVRRVAQGARWHESKAAG